MAGEQRLAEIKAAEGAVAPQFVGDGHDGLDALQVDMVVLLALAC